MSYIGSEYHKENGRKGFDLGRETQKLNAIARVEEYNQNPNFCAQCFQPLNYKKKTAKFCGSSCAATFNNSKRKHSEETKAKIAKSNTKKQHKAIVAKRLKTNRSAYELNSKTCIICSEILPYEIRGRNTCSYNCMCQHLSNRYRERRKREGHRSSNCEYFTSKFAGRVYLESSYESKVANILEENNINWTRPKYVNYELDGKIRMYYPDFYLVDYDLYLDPKNAWAIKGDQRKLDAVRDQTGINLHVLTKDQLTLEHIMSLV